VFIPAVLIIALLMSACNKQLPRLPAVYTYNPGAVFTTNIKDEDPRRVVKCSIIFEVLDEKAVAELADYNFAIRNAVISVLGELTSYELTIGKDLEDISKRLVIKANEAIYGPDLIIGAYFTDFALA